MQLSLYSVLLLFAILLVVACATPVVTRQYVMPAAVPSSFEQVPSRRLSPCDDPANYIPDSTHLDHYFVKEMRVNIHFMNSADSSQNLNGQTAIDFAKGLVRAANYDLAKNEALFLPHRNTIPVYPLGYRYVLTGRPDDPADEGIYFHYDDELYFYTHKGRQRNLSDRQQIKTYGIQVDTVHNFFLMPHHPDSVASATYSAFGVGVALGNHAKMAGQWINAGREDYWNYRQDFNHEAGHNLSLAHAWLRDGCDDTVEHNLDCWNRDKGPGCDTLTSNNVMDYNAIRNAWSPCQIGRIQYQLAREGSPMRKTLVPNWCQRDPAKDITITDTVVWECHKDLEGNLLIADGGHLTTRCRLSLPANGRITVAAGGTLVLAGTRLHNACGQNWQGIFTEKKGAQTGTVVWQEATLENVDTTPN